MKVLDAVNRVKTKCSPFQIKEHASTPFVLSEMNAVISSDVLLDLMDVGRYLYVGDLYNVEATSLTEAGDSYTLDLSTLSNTPFEGSITAWVSSDSISVSEYSDNVLVKFVDESAAYRLISYNDLTYDEYVFGVRNGNTLIVKDTNYSYIAVQYVQEPTQYTVDSVRSNEPDLPFSNAICEGLVVNKTASKINKIDRGEISQIISSKYTKDYYRTLEKLKKNTRSKKTLLLPNKPNYGYGNYL